MCSKNTSLHFMAFTVMTLFGFISSQAVGSKDLFRCRQSCYQKFVQDWHHCMDFEDCKNMCITPPNINSYIPEAFSFLCWNNCDQQLGPFPLNINSALRQGSLVITDIAWDQAITNASKQCLVTWEVSGGGLMGNLLTDSSAVELSLWSDTVYHVQVTCKHKETGGMRRSFKLIIDTHKLGDSSATGMQAIAMEATFANQHLTSVYGNEAVPPSPSETESRLRILKDSSKDFLTPYNPTSAGVQKTAKPKPSVLDTAENEIHAGSSSTSSNSVLRTKLIGAASSSEEALPFVSNSILMAVLGSILLFLAIVALYLILRPVRKHVPTVVCPIDRQVLIHTELGPGQTSSMMTSPPPPPPAAAAAAQSAAAPQQQSADAQRATLHV